MSRRKRNRSRGLLVLGMFIGAFVIAIIGIQFLTKTGIFKVPGVVYYDDSLNEDELGLLKSIFTEDVVLDADVKISAKESNFKPELEEDELLYQISVPVTDFYDARENAEDFDESEYQMVPIEDLNFQKKLLSKDGKYYLDDFDGGAVFRAIKFGSDKYEEEIEPLIEKDFKKTFPTKDTVLSFAQTGVTAMSRGMNKKLVEEGGDATYFAANIKDYLSGFDSTHTSNESSFTPLASDENICSDTRFIDTLTAIGLDIVELTGNHNTDCGSEAANNSIDIYNENNIRIVGGGKNAEEAAKPLQLNEKGNDVTFLAYNLSTGGATTGDAPGANQYSEENAAAEIATAKERGDFVIVDMQYYECSAYDTGYENTACDYANSSAGDQIGDFRHLIDLGADMVVGTSAHQPQTFELYENGVIYYGLGNLFFDQIWWPGTTRSLILSHYFYNGKLLQTKIVPTIYDSSMQTELLDSDSAQIFIQRLISARP